MTATLHNAIRIINLTRKYAVIGSLVVFLLGGTIRALTFRSKCGRRRCSDRRIW